MAGEADAASQSPTAADGTMQWSWILNLVVWLAIFVAGAVWSLRRDTARV